MHHLFLLIFIIGIPMAMSSTLNVFFGGSEKSPYHIHADALSLSTFNAAVMGQLIQTVNGVDLKQGHLEVFHFDYGSGKYILKLKDNVFFHNGRKANSKDLEFSLTRGFYSPDKNFFTTYLGNIEGIENIKSGSKYRSGAVSGVKILNELTVAVKLKAPNPSFLHTLTLPYFSLFPKEALEDDCISWKNTPIGAGTYKVIKKFDGTKTVLNRTSSPEKGEPAEVIIHAKEPERIDVARNSIEGPAFKTRTPKLAASVRILVLSNQHELSKNPNFKKGINLLINREVIGSEELGITPTDQMLPRHFWGRASHAGIPNLEKAKEYISKVPATLLEQTHQIAVFSGPTFSKTHEHYISHLTEQFKRVGLKVNFVPSSEKFDTPELANENFMSLWNIVTDYVDPLIMFSAFKKNSFSRFYSPYGEQLENYDQLYRRAAGANNFEKRNETVRALSQYIQDEALIIPLAEERRIFGYNTQTIETLGEQEHPMTLFIENIRMKK